MPVPNAPDVANDFEVKSIASDATGVYVLGERLQGMTRRQSALVKPQPATGAVIFTRFYDGNLLAAVIDETTITSFGTPGIWNSVSDSVATRQGDLLIASDAYARAGGRWSRTSNAPLA